jgi:hypothetical protein
MRAEISSRTFTRLVDEIGACRSTPELEALARRIWSDYPGDPYLQLVEEWIVTKRAELVAAAEPNP